MFAIYGIQHQSEQLNHNEFNNATESLIKNFMKQIDDHTVDIIIPKGTNYNKYFGNPIHGSHKCLQIIDDIHCYSFDENAEVNITLKSITSINQWFFH